MAEHRKRFGPADKGAPWIDLRTYEISGVRAVDRYTYRVRVRGKYPQFLYWLAMPFLRHALGGRQVLLAARE